MKLIDIEKIKVKERIRKVFDEDAIYDLADSIESKGLLHPVVLQNDGETLLAGERRLRAIKTLHKVGRKFSCQGVEVPESMCPYILAKEMSEDDILEAELEENIMRQDLSWEEVTLAKAALHKLRVKQKGEYSKDNPKGQRLLDTAAEILGLPAEELKNTNAPYNLADDLMLAEALEKGEIKPGKSRQKTLRALIQKREMEHKVKLAALVKDSKHKILQGDCIEVMKSLRDNSIDGLITDPPYGIEAGDFGGQAAAKHTYQDSPEAVKSLLPAFMKELDRCAKEDFYGYIFCDIDFFLFLRNLAEENGFIARRTPLIWVKTLGMLAFPDVEPRHCNELILMIRRGTTSHPAVTDVFTVPSLGKPKFGAQKPGELYKQILERSCSPGDIVLDPFAGAGPVLEAADALSLRAVAIELDEEKVAYMKVHGSLDLR